MKIALLSPNRKWSVYQIMEDLKKQLSARGHVVDLIMSRAIRPYLRRYDRIYGHFRFQQDYDNDLFRNEINEKMWIHTAGGEPGVSKRIADWSIFDHIVAQSEFVYDDLPDDVNKTICPAGVDTEIFFPENTRRKYDVGTVGNRNQTRKRYQKVKEITEIYDSVWHDGWNEDYVNRRALRELYNSMEIYLSLSLYEGGHMPLLEAGACGVPLVSTPVGYAPNIESCKIVPFDATTEEVREAIESHNENPYDEIRESWSWEALLPKWEEVMDLV